MNKHADEALAAADAVLAANNTIAVPNFESLRLLLAQAYLEGQKSELQRALARL